MAKLNEKQKISIRELIKTQLSVGSAEVVFEKADGTIRTMKATRDKDVIIGLTSKEQYEAYVNPAKPRKEAVDMVPVFDVQLKEWRGFSFDKLISVNGVKAEHIIRLVG